MLIVCAMGGFQTREMFYVDLVFCFAILCGMRDIIGLSYIKEIEKYGHA